jgi:hypothetical protein
MRFGLGGSGWGSSPQRNTRTCASGWCGSLARVSGEYGPIFKRPPQIVRGDLENAAALLPSSVCARGAAPCGSIAVRAIVCWFRFRGTLTLQSRHFAGFHLAGPSAPRPNVTTKSVPLRSSPAPARKTPTWFVRPVGGVPFTVSWNTECSGSRRAGASRTDRVGEP